MHERGMTVMYCIKDCIRPKIAAFPLTCRNKLGSVGREFFLIFVSFLYTDSRAKLFLGALF